MDTRATRLTQIIEELANEVAGKWLVSLAVIPDEVGDGAEMGRLYAEFASTGGEDSEDDSEGVELDRAIELTLQVAHCKLIALMGEEERGLRLQQIYGDF